MKPLTLEFIDNHIPGLPDGDYRLTVSQSLSTEQAQEISDSQAAQYLYFSVCGPRYSLDPTLVRSHFPPAKSNGEYANLLPHIVFNRSTILWERSIDSDDSQYQGVPWMAVLVVTQEEVVQYGLSLQTVTVASLESASTSPVFPGLSPEVGQSSSDSVQVVDLPLSVLQATVPPVSDLRLLGHVRKVGELEVTPGTPPSVSVQPLPPTTQDGEETDLYPIMVANRLPTMGQEAYVMVVSLECRTDIYANVGDNYDPDNADTLYRLIVLDQWTVTATAESTTFTDYLLNAATPTSGNQDLLLRQDLLATDNLSGDELTSAQTANMFLQAGYTALSHLTRQGNRLVSWYRGPFITGELAESIPDFETMNVESQDQLVRYYSNVGMLDESYAAAWQLGQLMTLQNSDVATALYNWKRYRAAAAEPDLLSYLPYVKAHSKPPLPANVVQWFRDLALFKGVPFNYLCPVESMLPTESLRMFLIDPFWRECLLDGAFSVGQVTGTDKALDQEERQELWECLEDVTPLSGFLLRSTVVEGWPHMQVAGYNTTPPSSTDEDGPFAEPIATLRKESLGNDILLCLFDDVLETLDLHEVPEVIHFGVGYAGDGAENDGRPTWYKAYRDVNTAVEQTEMGYVNVEDYWTESTRTLQIGSLAQALADLGSQTEDCPGNPWWVAFEMIEGVERVRILAQGWDSANAT